MKLNPCEIQEWVEATEAEVERLCKRVEAAEAEVERLRAAIRMHRDQRGDDRCWMDDAALYALLPEGGEVTSGPLPPPEEMLENCKRFIRLRSCPGEGYVSPQREIERLTAEVARLRELLGLEQRTCPICYTSFDVALGVGRVDKIYCSPACRNRAYRQRLRESANGQP